MNGRDYYRVLGVSRHASTAQVRSAFASLVKRYHPDMASADTDLPGRLAEIERAYRCLSHAETRSAHDRALQERERLHFSSQRDVQRRLQRYDLRHSRRLRRWPRMRRWRRMLILFCGAAITAKIVSTLAA